jgi:hypothetical protein
LGFGEGREKKKCGRRKRKGKLPEVEGRNKR